MYLCVCLCIDVKHLFLFVCVCWHCLIISTCSTIHEGLHIHTHAHAHAHAHIYMQDAHDALTVSVGKAHSSQGHARGGHGSHGGDCWRQGLDVLDGVSEHAENTAVYHSGVSV